MSLQFIYQFADSTNDFNSINLNIEIEAFEKRVMQEWRTAMLSFKIASIDSFLNRDISYSKLGTKDVKQINVNFDTSDLINKIGLNVYASPGAIDYKLFKRLPENYGLNRYFIPFKYEFIFHPEKQQIVIEFVADETRYYAKISNCEFYQEVKKAYDAYKLNNMDDLANKIDKNQVVTSLEPIHKYYTFRYQNVEFPSYLTKNHEKFVKAAKNVYENNLNNEDALYNLWAQWLIIEDAYLK